MTNIFWPKISVARKKQLTCGAFEYSNNSRYIYGPIVQLNGVSHVYIIYRVSNVPFAHCHFSFEQQRLLNCKPCKHDVMFLVADSARSKRPT